MQAVAQPAVPLDPHAITPHQSGEPVLVGVGTDDYGVEPSRRVCLMSGLLLHSFGAISP